jgi:hypothetical protein
MDNLPSIGQQVYVKNQKKYGEGPAWVVALVTDLASRIQAAPDSSPRKERKETVVYGFRATVFYPEITITNPENVYKFDDVGSTWATAIPEE